jgi:hypothetical protein
MRCRGFNGRFFSLQKFTTGSNSWIFSLVMTIIIIGLTILEWSV